MPPGAIDLLDDEEVNRMHRGATRGIMTERGIDWKIRVQTEGRGPVRVELSRCVVETWQREDSR